eukprot:Sspe_Gene.34629::Locus_16824_Transcript_1_1_Confidence_1.000_Length_5256::g.34629::m.34629
MSVVFTRRRKSTLHGRDRMLGGEGRGPMDRDQYIKPAAQVLEMIKYKEMLAGIFRCALSYGEPLARQLLPYSRFYRLLVMADIVPFPRNDRPRKPESPFQAFESDDDYLAHSPTSSTGDWAPLWKDPCAFNRVVQQAQMYRVMKENVKQSGLKNAYASNQQLSEAMGRKCDVDHAKGYRARRTSTSVTPFMGEITAPSTVASDQSVHTKVILSEKEADQLFRKCTSDGDTLTLKDFTVACLRMAEARYPDEYLNSSSSALLYFLQEYMFDLQQVIAPGSLTALRLHSPLQNVLDIADIVKRYRVPLRKVFIRYVGQQEEHDGDDSVDIRVATITFESLVRIMKETRVFPGLISHSDVYGVFTSLYNPKVLSKVEGLPYSDFVEAIVALAFISFSGHQFRTKIPTPAGRLQCFLERWDELYFHEFHVKIQEDLGVEVPQIPVLHDILPNTGDAEGGYNVVLTGRDFSPANGVVIRFGDVRVTSHEVTESKVKVRVPEQKPERFVSTVRLVDNQYLIQVTFVKNVSVTVSNDGENFTEPSEITFTYKEPRVEFHLSDLQVRMQTIFADYCSKGDYYNDRYMTKEKWLRFRREFDIQEIPPPEVKPPPDTYYFDEYSIEHMGEDVLNFKRFLAALVCCLVAVEPHCSPNEVLQQMFGTEENINKTLLRQLDEEQSSFTAAKARQLASILSILNATGGRKDNSPADGYFVPAQLEESYPKGAYSNADELESLLLDYLQQDKDRRDAEDFVAWQQKVEMDTMQRKAAGDDTEAPPPVVVPEEKLVKDREEEEDRFPVIGLKPSDSETPMLDPVQRKARSEFADSDDDESDEDLEDAIYFSKSQLLDILLKLAHDRMNVVVRREFHVREALELKVHDLRAQLEEKEAQLSELRTYVADGKVVRGPAPKEEMAFLDYELLRQTHLRIERELMELAEAEHEQRQRQQLEDDADLKAEIVDREREKLLQAFREEVLDTDSRFRTACGLLADQTQWIASQRNVLAELNDRLKVAEFEADAYRELCEKVMGMTLDKGDTALAEALRRGVQDTSSQKLRLYERLKRIEDTEDVSRARRASAIQQLKDAVLFPQNNGDRSRSFVRHLEDMENKSEPPEPPTQSKGKKKGKKGKGKKDASEALSLTSNGGETGFTKAELQEAVAEASRNAVLATEDRYEERIQYIEEAARQQVLALECKLREAEDTIAIYSTDMLRQQQALQLAADIQQTSLQATDTASDSRRASRTPNEEVPPAKHTSEHSAPESSSGRPGSADAMRESEGSVRDDSVAVRTESRHPSRGGTPPSARTQSSQGDGRVQSLQQLIASKDKELEELQQRMDQYRKNLEAEVADLQGRLQNAHITIPDGYTALFVRALDEGETLETVAKKYGHSPSEIAKLNATVGSISEKVVVLPLADEQLDLMTSADEYSAARKSSFIIHPIAVGTDTLAAICARYGVDDTAVRRANFLPCGKTEDEAAEQSADPSFIAGIASRTLRIPSPQITQEDDRSELEKKVTSLGKELSSFLSPPMEVETEHRSSILQRSSTIRKSIVERSFRLKSLRSMSIQVGGSQVNDENEDASKEAKALEQQIDADRREYTAMMEEVQASFRRDMESFRTALLNLRKAVEHCGTGLGLIAKHELGLYVEKVKKLFEARAVQQLRSEDFSEPSNATCPQPVSPPETSEKGVGADFASAAVLPPTRRCNVMYTIRTREPLIGGFGHVPPHTKKPL